jgi:hypothetical protein
MHSVREDAIGGFNQFLEEQKKLEGPASITLTLFNHKLDFVLESAPIERADKLDEETFRPDGMTALMDAVGRTLRKLDHRIGKRDARPDQVIVLILTDGRENASRQFRRREIGGVIDEYEERGWEFVFWGADIDAAHVASRMHIDESNVSHVDATGEGVDQAFGEMSQLTQDFRESGSLDEALRKYAESSGDDN